MKLSCLVVAASICGAGARAEVLAWHLQDEAAPVVNKTTSDIAPTLAPEEVVIANINQLVDVSPETEGYQDIALMGEWYNFIAFRKVDGAEGAGNGVSAARFDPEEQVSVASLTVWVCNALNYMSALADMNIEDTESVGYIIDIRPLLGHVERGNSTLRPLVDRIEPNAANWYNDKVISFPERWADDGEAEPIDLTDEDAQRAAEEELNKPRPAR